MESGYRATVKLQQIWHATRLILRGRLDWDRMSLALGVHLTARTIAIRPVDRKILSTSINERIVLGRQKGNNGAASYNHPLLGYAKHVLQKPLDP